MVSEDEFESLKQEVLQLKTNAQFFSDGIQTFLQAQQDQLKGGRQNEFQLYKRFMGAQMAEALDTLKGFLQTAVSSQIPVEPYQKALQDVSLLQRRAEKILPNLEAFSQQVHTFQEGAKPTKELEALVQTSTDSLRQRLDAFETRLSTFQTSTTDSLKQLPSTSFVTTYVKHEVSAVQTQLQTSLQSYVPYETYRRDIDRMEQQNRALQTMVYQLKAQVEEFQETATKRLDTYQSVDIDKETLRVLRAEQDANMKELKDTFQQECAHLFTEFEKAKQTEAEREREIQKTINSKLLYQHLDDWKATLQVTLRTMEKSIYESLYTSILANVDTTVVDLKQFVSASTETISSTLLDDYRKKEQEIREYVKKIESGLLQELKQRGSDSSGQHIQGFQQLLTGLQDEVFKLKKQFTILKVPNIEKLYTQKSDELEQMIKKRIDEFESSLFQHQNFRKLELDTESIRTFLEDTKQILQDQTSYYDAFQAHYSPAYFTKQIQTIETYFHEHKSRMIFEMKQIEEFLQKKITTNLQNTLQEIQNELSEKYVLFKDDILEKMNSIRAKERDLGDILQTYQDKKYEYEKGLYAKFQEELQDKYAQIHSETSNHRDLLKQIRDDYRVYKQTFHPDFFKNHIDELNSRIQVYKDALVQEVNDRICKTISQDVYSFFEKKVKTFVDEHTSLQISTQKRIEEQLQKGQEIKSIIDSYYSKQSESEARMFKHFQTEAAKQFMLLQGEVVKLSTIVNDTTQQQQDFIDKMSQRFSEKSIEDIHSKFFSTHFNKIQESLNSVATNITTMAVIKAHIDKKSIEIEQLFQGTEANMKLLHSSVAAFKEKIELEFRTYYLNDIKDMTFVYIQQNLHDILEKSYQEIIQKNIEQQLYDYVRKNDYEDGLLQTQLQTETTLKDYVLTNIENVRYEIEKMSQYTKETYTPITMYQGTLQKTIKDIHLYIESALRESSTSLHSTIRAELTSELLHYVQQTQSIQQLEELSTTLRTFTKKELDELYKVCRVYIGQQLLPYLTEEGYKKSLDTHLDLLKTDIRTYLITYLQQELTKVQASNVSVIETLVAKQAKQILDSVRDTKGTKGIDPFMGFGKPIEKAEKQVSLPKELKKCFVSACIGNKGQTVDKITKFTPVKGWEYILFTNLQLPSDLPWERRAVERTFDDPAMDAKMYKWLTHKFLPDYDIIVWIDCYLSPNTRTIELFEKDIYTNLIENKAGILHRPHAERTCIWDECDAVVKSRRAKPEDVQKNRRLLEKVAMPRNLGLFDTNILVKNNKDTHVQTVCEEIFETMKTASNRDQLVVTYVYYKEKFTDYKAGDLMKYFIKTGNHVRIPAYL